MIQLTENERGLLALALFGLADRQRQVPQLLERMAALAAKLGLEGDVAAMAKSFMRSVAPTSAPGNSAATSPAQPAKGGE